MFAHAAKRITKAMAQIDRWTGQVEIGIEECKAEIEGINAACDGLITERDKVGMAIKVAEAWLAKMNKGA